MPASQVRMLERPSNSGSFRCTTRNISCTTSSSAARGTPRFATARHTNEKCVSYTSRNEGTGTRIASGEAGAARLQRGSVAGGTRSEPSGKQLTQYPATGPELVYLGPEYLTQESQMHVGEPRLSGEGEVLSCLEHGAGGELAAAAEQRDR